MSLVAFDNSETIVADVSKSELIEMGATDAANNLTVSTRSLAANERRECRFRAAWLVGDRVLGSYAWRAGESENHMQAQLDGSLQSLLAQNQRHLENIVRVFMDREARTERATERLQAQLERRNTALEQRIEDLAQQLRERTNTEDDLATAELAAQLESRTRRQEMLYARAAPIIDALLARFAANPQALLQQLGPQPSTPEPAAANGGEPNGRAS